MSSLDLEATPDGDSDLDFDSGGDLQTSSLKRSGTHATGGEQSKIFLWSDLRLNTDRIVSDDSISVSSSDNITEERPAKKERLVIHIQPESVRARALSPLYSTPPMGSTTTTGVLRRPPLFSSNLEPNLVLPLASKSTGSISSGLDGLGGPEYSEYKILRRTALCSGNGSVTTINIAGIESILIATTWRNGATGGLLGQGGFKTAVSVSNPSHLP